jgi:hypothetical protein
MYVIAKELCGQGEGEHVSSWNLYMVETIPLYVEPQEWFVDFLSLKCLKRTLIILMFIPRKLKITPFLIIILYVDVLILTFNDSTLLKYTIIPQLN